MYNPAPFAEQQVDPLRNFLNRHPFAILVTNGASGPEATHAPTVFHPEIGSHGALRCHLARANSHLKTLDSSPVLAIFQGAQHYITPNWYPSKQEHGQVVPTWNYLTVHVRGRARLFEDREQIIEHVRTLTARHEQAFEAPWSVSDAPRDYIENMARAIVGVEIVIESIEGKAKVSQNRPEPDREGVVEGLNRIGSESAVTIAAHVGEGGFPR